MARPYLLMSHRDYHNTDDSPVGEGFDAAAFAGQLAAGGVDGIYTFAKCHYGNSYYPTKVGRPHPRLTRDLTVPTETFRRLAMSLYSNPSSNNRNAGLNAGLTLFNAA